MFFQAWYYFFVLAILITENCRKQGNTVDEILGNNREANCEALFLYQDIKQGYFYFIFSTG
jgi:hypothetical protein